MAEAVRIGWTTLPSREEADRLAAGAVEAGLAACAQVDGPIRSHFTWEGQLQSEDEWRVTLKHAASQADNLQAWILARHPHAVAQWVAVEAAAVAPAYRAWVLGTR